MPFVKELLNYRSLSIVGLEKNTGKTECLNYILGRLPLERVKVGISSIGIDGESVDQVTQTSKPEIFLREGLFFTTSEKHYKERRVLSELLEIEQEQTSLGRLITAKALTNGRVKLSGPPSSNSLKKWIGRLQKNYNVDLSIIDGALSRLSPASPAVSEAMILTTGAAVSLSSNQLINKTAFVVELIEIERCQEELPEELIEKNGGVWGYNREERESFYLFESAFLLERGKRESKKGEQRRYDLIFVSGALTERLLKILSSGEDFITKEIVVRDFTKIFITPLLYRSFLKRGGKISVVNRSHLIAICVNPISPTGYSFDSNEICRELEERVKLPIYDIFKYKN